MTIKLNLTWLWDSLLIHQHWTGFVIFKSEMLTSRGCLCISEAHKCELSCRSKETGDVVFMNQVMHDGTPCSYTDPFSICARGECLVRIVSILMSDSCTNTGSFKPLHLFRTLNITFKIYYYLYNLQKYIIDPNKYILFDIKQQTTCIYKSLLLIKAPIIWSKIQ